MSIEIQFTHAKHTLFQADSRLCSYQEGFHLLLTCPPYYHPRRAAPKHGICYLGDIHSYADATSEVLLRCAEAVRHRRVCFVKTDVWYKGMLLPISYAIADACVRKGLRLRAQWIWQRLPSFSPYAPAFSNVFFFADHFTRPAHLGLIATERTNQNGKRTQSTQTHLFRMLINLLTRNGDVVIDPFVGTGSVIEAAASVERRSVGVECSKAQVRLAAEKLKNVSGLLLRKPGSSCR